MTKNKQLVIGRLGTVLYMHATDQIWQHSKHWLMRKVNVIFQIDIMMQFGRLGQSRRKGTKLLSKLSKKYNC